MEWLIVESQALCHCHMSIASSKFMHNLPINCHMLDIT